jgi:hypothetical protein
MEIRSFVANFFMGEDGRIDRRTKKYDDVKSSLSQFFERASKIRKLVLSRGWSFTSVR